MLFVIRANISSQHINQGALWIISEYPLGMPIYLEPSDLLGQKHHKGHDGCCYDVISKVTLDMVVTLE